MNKQYKVDLHTHSILSKDGAVTREQYALLLEKKILDCIAITDHNETRFAKTMKAEFGEKIIIGEEISTKDGEIIGLFLQKTIPPALTALQTAELIHDQDAIVYIPHPFEKLRHGIKEEVLAEIIDYVDIIEVFNARARWRGESQSALRFAGKYNLSGASSSDSHCLMGVGSSYSILSAIPGHKTITDLLSTAACEKRYAPILSYLCPSVNKIKHKLKLYV